MAYCTDADVIPFLPSGGLPNPARTATANSSGDYLECEGHGLADAAAVTLRAATGGSVPTGLTAGTVYYARVLSASRFQLAATAGGAAINLTAAGSNFVFASPLPIAAWREWAAREIDSFLPPHVTPLVDPIPQVVVTANAELAAFKGLAVTGGAEIDLGAKIDQIAARLTRWAKGVPVRGTTRSVTSPSHLAVSASAGAVDPRGWATRGNERLP